METKVFKLEKEYDDGKQVLFLEFSQTEEDMKSLGAYTWFGWKIEMVKK